MNLKFQNAIKRVPQKVPPIWMMRQAGRYHSHYQKLRRENSFMDLCKKPALAAEVALGPVEDFDFDVSILFSDLLFPLEAMGMGLDYNPGPVLEWHLRSVDDLKKLDTSTKVLERLVFQKEACEQTRRQLPADKSLIGFVGGPWTLFSYAVGGSHETRQVKEHLSLFKPFCEKLIPLLEKNIQLQFDGGVEAVMVLDTSAGELSPLIYNQLIVPIIQKLAQKFPKRLGYYSKHTNWEHIDTLLKDQNIGGLGVDHRWSLEKLLPKSLGFFQGNFDQQLLFLPPREFETELRSFLQPLTRLTEKERSGWVCGLGHGILPQTPEENVRSFVKIVREVMSEA